MKTKLVALLLILPAIARADLSTSDPRARVQTSSGTNLILKGPNPWVDVKAYGAKGNGSTDDTAAIQNAINAAVNFDQQGTGATVFVPAGIYLINATGLTLAGNAGINSNGQGVWLVGEGMGSQLLSNSSTMTVLTITGNRNGVQNLFFNSYSTQTLVTHIAISALTTNSNFNRVNNVFFTNGSTNVVVQSSVSWGAAYNQISNSDSLAVQKCNIWIRTVPIAPPNSLGTRIDNVRAGSAATAYGVYLDGGGQETITGYAGEGLNYAIYVASSPVGTNRGGAEGTTILGGRYEANTTNDIFISTAGSFVTIIGGDLEFGIGTHIEDHGNGTQYLGNPSLVQFPGYCFGGSNCPVDGYAHLTKSSVLSSSMTIAATLTVSTAALANNAAPAGSVFIGPDQNTATQLYVTNASAGALAEADLNACTASGSGGGQCGALSVTGSSYATVGMFNPAQATVYSGVNLSSGLAIIARGTGAAQTIRFGTGSTNGIERARIDASGNLGINTTAPGALLDVNGNAQFGSGATKSTITATGDFIGASGSSITLSGANGFLKTSSSVTASGFFGDGSNVTNLAPANLAAGTASASITFASTTVSTTFFVGASSVSAVGSWATWTPTVNGCSGAATVNVARYMRLGKTLTFTLDVQCTSNATTFSLSAPYLLQGTGVTSCTTEDNGAFNSALGNAEVQSAGSATIIFVKDGGVTNTDWTASGTKRVICSGTFELQ